MNDKSEKDGRKRCVKCFFFCKCSDGRTKLRTTRRARKSEMGNWRETVRASPLERKKSWSKALNLKGVQSAPKRTKTSNKTGPSHRQNGWRLSGVVRCEKKMQKAKERKMHGSRWVTAQCSHSVVLCTTARKHSIERKLKSVRQACRVSD